MKFSKRFILILPVFLFLSSSVFATEISLSANDINISTDDIVQVSISVDGQIDGGQLAIEGIENFNIVGQQSSSQVQIINGNSRSIQEKVLSLNPKNSGDFTLTVLARKDGEEIRSKSINLKVEQSFIESTKESLLKDSDEENKVDFLKESQQGEIAETNLTPAGKIETFPKVEHISAFNGIFWLELFGALLLIGVIFLIFSKLHTWLDS